VANNCFNLIFSLAQLLHRYAPGAKVAPSPSGSKIQVKQMLGGRRKCGAKEEKEKFCSIRIRV